MVLDIHIQKNASYKDNPLHENNTAQPKADTCPSVLHLVFTSSSSWCLTSTFKRTLVIRTILYTETTQLNQKADTCPSVLHLVFTVSLLSVDLWLDKGDYPENPHVVF